MELLKYKTKRATVVFLALRRVLKCAKTKNYVNTDDLYLKNGAANNRLAI